MKEGLVCKCHDDGLSQVPTRLAKKKKTTQEDANQAAAAQASKDSSHSVLILMKRPTFTLLLLLLVISVPLNASALGSRCYSSEWKILTKHNFSTQIRIHPHILLLTTLPWLGESRALMRDVAQAINRRKPDFASLELMFMHRNTEKMLADAIGATAETTLLYFHHSKSYKYQGRLRAHNILSALQPLLSVPAVDVPLKLLTSPEELRAFLDSTDKAFLLLDFCGWTHVLRRGEWKNATEYGFSAQGDACLGANANPTLPGWSAEQKCGVGGDLSGIPWLGKFGSVSDAASWGSKETRLDTEFSCNLQDFPVFESFFSTFMTLARELFLPPEKHRFGLVVQRSLLSSLGVEEPKPLSVMVHYAGCPSCSKLLKVVDDFKSSMKIDNPIIAELKASGHTPEPVLPANKPSMVLFVDRSSESSVDRVKSVEALNALRELSWHLKVSHHLPAKRHGKLGGSTTLSHQQQRSSSRHPNLKLSASSQTSKTKAKISITSINDGKEKHVSSDRDLNEDSLHEILTYLVQQKEESQLSLLAKKVGFHLLSDDFEIKIGSMSSKTGAQPSQGSLKISQESHRSDIRQNEKQLLNGPTTSPTQVEETCPSMHRENSKCMYPESSQGDEDRGKSSGRSEKMEFPESGHLTANTRFVNAEDFVPEKSHALNADELKGEELRIEGFNGSFYFSDGDYRLLRTLTGDSKIPSLVIIDPNLQQHYLYPDEKNFSFDMQAQFMRDYLNARVLPYQLSESVLPISREAASPPFVNIDFHESDSIPRITSRTLLELISGINQLRGGTVPSHWQKDIFVLFSNRWCGFCQRMELVVREVYRALKGYMDMLKSEFQYDKVHFIGDNFEDSLMKLPVICLLDCTLNDCSLIFRTINKGEVYPTLVLFPAGNRSPVTYEGEIEVSSIINFMAEHESCPHHLISENGILWSRPVKGGSPRTTYFKDRSADAIDLENPSADDRFHEVPKNRFPERVSKNSHWAKSQNQEGVEELGVAAEVGVGSILVATEKLVGAQPFDNSMVLILRAGKGTGFQGLIVNKHITWDSLRELEGGSGSEVLRGARVSLGGPVTVHGLRLVALTRRAAKDHRFAEVLPGIYFVDQLGTVGEIERLKLGIARVVTDYWFFLGYASWGWDQLLGEIAEGAWMVSRGDSMELLEWPREVSRAEE